MGFLKALFQNKKSKVADNSNHPLAYKFNQGEACNVISNSYGEFGKEATNPIPVNGPRGEILFLGNLRTESNEFIFFHRIAYQEVAGLDEGVDVFELTSSSGKIWDLIFLHMYHPRNSNSFPRGYKFTSDKSIFSELPVGLGITTWTDNFPKGLTREIDDFYGNIAPLSKTVDKYTNNVNFVRPISHLSKMLQLSCANHFFEKLSNDISVNYSDNYILNLLMQRDLKLQFVGIKCVQLKKQVSKELINGFSRSALYHRDSAFISEIIKTMPRLDKEAHKALKEINNPLMWSMYIGSNFLDLIVDPFGDLSIPYLFLTRNQQNCPTELKIKIDELIDKMTYR